MAEENVNVKETVVEKGTAVKDNAPKPIGDEGLTQGGMSVKTVLDAVSNNPELANDPEIKKLVDMATTSNIQTNVKKSNVYDEGIAKKENTPDPVKEPAKTEAVKDDREEGMKWTNEDSIFSKKKEEMPDMSNFEEAIDYIYNKYSIDTKKDGFNKFFDSVNKWRNDSQGSSDSKRQLEDIQKSFENMPRPLYNSFVEWANGRNWVEGLGDLNTISMDYQKPFEQQDSFVMLNKYFPGEYEREDIDDKDPIINKALNLAKRQYELEQRSFSDRRVSIENQAKEFQENLSKSSIHSVEHLKNSFPDFSDSHLSEIKRVLDSGEINNLFYTETGVYKQDAAEKLAFLLFGKEELSKVMNKASKEGKSEALKDVVSRGADRPSVPSARPTQDANVDEVVQMFDGLFNKKHY
tara:strand:+ start:6982 stop:8205 length:1224 start_codon:yes stop_codon:yes gene_type:complete